ncbi:MAG: DUF6702 family protein [Bacteroidota bacterium]
MRWLIFLVSLVPLTSEDHAIYLSLVDLDLNAQKMTIKVFSDDLEDCLKNFDPTYTLFEHSSHNQGTLEKYFKQRLLLTINRETVKFSFSSSSVENDAHFLVFDFQYLKSISTVQVKADFFMELFPTQSNVINLKNGQEQLFLRLTKGEPEGQVDF